MLSVISVGLSVQAVKTCSLVDPLTLHHVGIPPLVLLDPPSPDMLKLVYFDLFIQGFPLDWLESGRMAFN